MVSKLSASEQVVRRQDMKFAFAPEDEGDEDITPSMPKLPDGRRFMHPGYPGSLPLVLENGERLLLRKHGSYVDLILVR